MWFALSPLAAPVRSWSKPEEKVERPQPLVRKCVWERAQAPAFKQRRISSLPLLPSPASPVYLPATPAATRQVVEPVRSHRSVGAPTVLHPDGISAREAEDQERERLARVWVGCARLVASSSSTLSKLRWDDDGCLLPLFVKSAPNTLRRHLSGWRVWASFCATLQWRAGAPSLQQLLDFVQGLQNGIRDDRGKNRKRSAMGVLNGMNYAAQVLSLSVLQEHLATPLLRNLRKGDEWSKPQETEAIPLPLCVVRNLEAALLENGEDTLFLAALLLMLWAGLRFSDIQRIDLSTVAAVDNSIRGFCWRTKSRKRGMPWACLRCGILGKDWAKTVVAEAAKALACCTKQDYFLPRYKKPMCYTTALANFRRCIVVHGGLVEGQAHLFSLHSLKATVLYWANLLAVGEVERVAQGHHKCALVPKCVPKYGRDDLVPQIRCQQHVIQALVNGWEPVVPLKRGLVELPIQQGTSLASRTAESVTDDSADDAALLAEGVQDVKQEVLGSADESGLDSSSCDEEQDPVNGGEDSPKTVGTPSNGWVLNTVTGVAHLAADRESLALACRPKLELNGNYQHWSSNPLVLGFAPCQHSGCRTAHEL